MKLSSYCISSILNNFDWEKVFQLYQINNAKIKNYFLKRTSVRHEEMLTSRVGMAVKTSCYVSALLTINGEHPEYLITGHCDGIISIWDIKTFTVLKSFHEHKSHINSFLYIAERNYLISAGYDGLIIIWDLKQKKSLVKIKTGSSIFCMQLIKYSQNDLEIVTGQICSSIAILNIKLNINCSYIKRTVDGLDIHANINVLLYIDQFNFLVSGSDCGVLKIWNTNDYSLYKRLPGHPCAINSILYYKEAKFITCSRDKTIRVWDIDNQLCTKLMICFQDAILNLLDLRKFTFGNCFCAISYKTIKIIDIENSGNILIEYPNDNLIYKMIPLATSNFVYAGFSVYKNEHIWLWK